MDVEVERNEIYVYLGVLRAGVEVLRFDVNATSSTNRLSHVDLIQTPGETGLLNISVKPNLTGYDEHGFIDEKLLFVGDAIAGFRIYTYGLLGG